MKNYLGVIPMNKEKILYLHSGAELYGADQILLTIVTNLDKNRFEPIVVLPNDGPLVKKLEEHQIRVEIIPYPIIRRKYFNGKGIINYIKEYFKSCKKLKEVVKREQISIVHNNTVAVLEGIYLKKKTKIKLITHVHEMIEHPKIVAKLLYKMHLKKCDDMVVVSTAVKNYIEQLLNKKFTNISVVYNGINNIHYDKKLHQKYLEEFGLNKNAKVVGIVGRINAIKGQDHYIEAMHRVIKNNKEVYGIIVGDAFDGQEWRVDQLINKIKEDHLEDKIFYCGFRKDMKELYNLLDILVLSSIQYDSFPTVVLEAMSCGIPTVAYKCGGVEEMIENDSNGFLVEQNDIDGLSKKISILIKDERKLQEFKKNSQKRFKKLYTTNQFIEKLSNIYHKKR